MPEIFHWDTVPSEQMNALAVRQVVHSDTMTIARLNLKKSCVVPLHHHQNEQICFVHAGRLLFVLDGKEQLVETGQFLRIPPNVPHSVKALEDSIAMDVFSPRREDWIRGDDAYLRG